MLSVVLDASLVQEEMDDVEFESRIEVTRDDRERLLHRADSPNSERTLDHIAGSFHGKVVTAFTSLPHNLKPPSDRACVEERLAFCAVTSHVADGKRSQLAMRILTKTNLNANSSEKQFPSPRIVFFRASQLAAIMLGPTRSCV